ncbi:transposase [Bradyrhizobium diazoefficiens]|uniref:transposase n=1 Tax=Bradyrhizobium diazoefficiens TaxID=1355477 RepID=UPI0034E38E78
MSATARRNGLSTSQLFTWRRLAREGRLGGDAAPLLVPVCAFRGIVSADFRGS